MSTSQAEDPDDPDTIAAWEAKGFARNEARAWITAAPGRFTPWTASEWRREGFGPDDAAMWSEVFADPGMARMYRSAGYASPFDSTERKS
jgi:hypothetical protein